MSLAVVEGELVWSYLVNQYLVNQKILSCGPVSCEPGGKERSLVDTCAVADGDTEELGERCS